MQSIVVQTLAVGLFLTTQALAAPLEVTQVAADANWLAHVDVDAIRASTVVQKAWQKVLDKHPDVKDHLGIVRILIGMDPTTDIHGITVYGKVGGKGDAVTILTASMDPQRITLLTSVIPGRESTRHGDDTIHSWTPTCCKLTVTIATAFRGNEQLVIASSIERAKAALDVLNGKVPGLTDDVSLGGNIPAGTTFLARAEGVADVKQTCQVCKALQINAFRVVMGESEGRSFFRTRVTFANPKAITIAMTTIHSVQALTNLVCADELGRKFVNAIDSKRDQQTLTVLWNASADDVWTGLLRIEEAVAKQIARIQGCKEPKPEPKVENEASAKKSVPSEENF